MRRLPYDDDRLLGFMSSFPVWFDHPKDRAMRNSGPATISPPGSTQTNRASAEILNVKHNNLASAPGVNGVTDASDDRNGMNVQSEHVIVSACRSHHTCLSRTPDPADVSTNLAECDEVSASMRLS